MALTAGETTNLTKELTTVCLESPELRRIFDKYLLANVATTKTDTLAVMSTVMTSVFGQAVPTILP